MRNFPYDSLCSSVSLVCCLFLQECFSFATVFSSSDWFFYSFSSSLIKLCSSILFLSSVSILITNALDSLSGACVLGMDWGMYWGGWGKPDSVLGSFNLHPLPCFSSKQACACSSWRKSRFLTFVSFTDFHTNYRDLSFQGQTPGLTPNIWFKLFTHWGGSPSPHNLAPLLCFLPGAKVLTWPLLFPSYATQCGSFLQPWLYVCQSPVFLWELLHM